MRRTLRARLLVTYLVPTTAALALVATFAHGIAAQGLEASLGERLTSLAQAAASELRPADMVFLKPGDDAGRTYARVKKHLDALRGATGLARIVVFDREGRALVDADAAYPIGARIPDLARDRLEVERVLGGTATASAVMFEGTDGRRYKSGYAPVTDQDGRVVAGVLVDGTAGFFNTLLSFRKELVLLSALGLLGIVLVSVFFSKDLTRPVQALAGAAGRIGEGDLATPVDLPARGDEIGSLSRSLERMRQGLAARDRQLQMMLSGIAHEVRNPLGGIELFSGLLAEEVANDEEKLSHVRRIQKELSHLSRLVEEFLDYARERPLEPSEVDLGDMLFELSQLVGPDAEAKGVRLSVEGAEGGARVDADPGALRRAVLNLARNAVQAAPGGGKVVLSYAREGGEAILSVEDDGPGVAPEARERIFEPFYSTREKGSGLGLALVRKAAEAHGGTVRLVESALGGARFEVRLPGGAGTPKRREG